MHKKSIILVSVFLFILFICSGFVCASENVKSGISNVTNTVVDGVNHLGSDVRNGIGRVENGIEGALNMNDDKNAMNTTGNTMTDNTRNYTTTRTTADAGITNNTSTMWIWLVIAIAAIVIIGLVWYYGAQNTTHHDE